jgi:RNA polymerase sigma-70 factor (sigma-E family)
MEVKVAPTQPTGDGVGVTVDVDYESDFTALYMAHRQMAMRLAYLLVGDTDRAEDAVAEAFARIYPKWRRGKVTNFQAYLRRSVLNEVRDKGRRRFLERREEQRRRPEPSVDPGEDAATERQVLVRELNRLPMRQRAVVVLRYYEDFSEQDTATLLGVSVGSVKSSASRGLQRLRERLEERS